MKTTIATMILGDAILTVNWLGGSAYELTATDCDEDVFYRVSAFSLADAFLQVAQFTLDEYSQENVKLTLQ